jgi:hypothetical protein
MKALMAALHFGAGIATAAEGPAQVELPYHRNGSSAFWKN